jgi:putative ABC transport system ATP-binding protein
MNDSLVELEKVNLTYNKGKDNAFQALYDVNLKIKKGEFVVIFGPSGCGKSSLLNVIAGLENPDRGKIFIEKRNIVKMENKKKVLFHRKKMGMIFQAYNLISTLSVLDNVALPQMFINQNKSQREKRALDILNKFGIKEQAKKIPTELSGGQQQRIGIARAIINDPPLILADEPIGNLDSESANKVMEIMSNLNKKEGKTIILVSHNPENVRWGSYVIYMKDGKIVKEERINIAETPEDAPLNKKTIDQKGESEFETIMDKFKGLSKEQIGFLIEPLKAEIMTDFLLVPYSERQVKLIEIGIRKRISNKIDPQELLEFLDKPLNESGAGLDRRVSEKFCEKIESLIKISSFISNPKNIDAGVTKILVHFNQQSILKTEKNTQELNNLIKERITKKITHKKFKTLLDAPEKNGGIGLDKRTVARVLKEIDLILIMSYELAPEKENLNKKPAKNKEEIKNFNNNQESKSPFL